MRLIQTSLIAASFLAATAGVASADVVTFTTSFPTETTDFDVTNSLNGFDTTLGTLTGVTIGYTFDEGFTGTVTNNAPTMQSFKITESTDGTFAFAGADVLDDNASFAESYSNLAAGASSDFGPHNSSGADSISVTDFAAYESGPISVELSTLTGTTVLGGGGNIQNAIVTSAGGTATVTYTYTVPTSGTPEPATWAMMLAGFGMSGALLRRRARAATV